MKICHTINALRTVEEVNDYKQFIENKLFDGVEIFYPYNVSESRYLEYTNSLHTLKGCEFVLHLPHGPSNDLLLSDYTPNTIGINRIKDAIDYASLFNVQKLTLHLGRAFDDRIKAIKNVIDILTDLCIYASKYQMFIMVENMNGFSEIGCTVNELKYILDKVSLKVNNIKFILDTGHAYVSSKDVTSYIYGLKDYLYHLHFNDNKGFRDEHAPLGTGLIDFYAIFKALKEINYNELCCLEIIYKTSDDLLSYRNDILKYM